MPFGLRKAIADRLKGAAEPFIEKAQARASERDSAQEGFQNTLDALQTRIGQADDRASMGVRELFGDQISRFEDMARGTANQTKRALSQLSGLRGGDVTGRFAASVHQADQGAHEAMGNIMTQFQDRATAERGRAEGRGDQLTQLLLSGFGRVGDRADQMMMHDQARQDMRRQANMQLLGDILGLGGQIGGAIIGRPPTPG